MVTDFQAVVLGADLGVYALCRSLNDAYGIIPTVIAQDQLGPIANSKILSYRSVPDSADPAELLKVLEEVAAQSAGPRLLLVNSDWYVEFITQNREVLAQWYALPYPEDGVRAAVSDKARFAELCAQHGIDSPRTHVLEFDDAGAPDITELDFTYPLIAKASSSAAWQAVTFPQKRKVYEISSAQELQEELGHIQAAGFRDRFLIQEMIPGDDTQMRSVTAYVDQSGSVNLLCTAWVLLEEHTPSGLGNPAAMFTYEDAELAAQAEKFLTAVNYRGFANFDVKIDPRTGKLNFLEVNPRIGRNNYYVTASGINPMRHVVQDAVFNEPLPRADEFQENLYSIVPTRLLTRYLVDKDLKRRVLRLARAGKLVNPLSNPKDRSFQRQKYVALAKINQVVKFLKHYPRPSGTGF